MLGSADYFMNTYDFACGNINDMDNPNQALMSHPIEWAKSSLPGIVSYPSIFLCAFSSRKDLFKDKR